jgi:hypothetical protein
VIRRHLDLTVNAKLDGSVAIVIVIAPSLTVYGANVPSEVLHPVR